MTTQPDDNSQQIAFELFLRREEQSCDLLKLAYSLEHKLHVSLIPLVERRTNELKRLRARLAAVERDRQQARRLETLEQENAESRQSIEELRAALTTAEGLAAELKAPTSGGWRRYLGRLRDSR